MFNQYKKNIFDRWPVADISEYCTSFFIQNNRWASRNRPIVFSISAHSDSATRKFWSRLSIISVPHRRSSKELFNYVSRKKITDWGVDSDSNFPIILMALKKK